MNKRHFPRFWPLLLAAALLLSACTPRAGLEGRWRPDEQSAAMMAFGGPFPMDAQAGDAVMEFKGGKLLVTFGGKDPATLMREAAQAQGIELPTVPPGSQADSAAGGVTYRVEDGKLLFTMQAGGLSQEFTADYTLDGDKLSITAEGDTLTLQRIK